MECPRCRNTHVVKNGSANGVQKRLCRACGFQFTRSTPRGKPYRTKILAVTLYMSGWSLNRIGRLCGVSAQSILNWVRDLTAEYAAKPAPEKQAVMLDIDELRCYLEKKSTGSGTGQRWIAFPVDPWIEGAETTPDT